MVYHMMKMYEARAKLGASDPLPQDERVKYEKLCPTAEALLTYCKMVYDTTPHMEVCAITGDTLDWGNPVTGQLLNTRAQLRHLLAV
jgi:hypothetical protein